MACVLFGAAAWQCADRDQYIGWDATTRAVRLHLITNNTRFLPWVQSPCLASHVLGLVVRRIAADWQRKYGHPVYLLETFVERQRFAGTCYRAAKTAAALAVTGAHLTEAELQDWRRDMEQRLDEIQRHPEQNLGFIEEELARAAKEPLRLLAERAAQAKANGTLWIWNAVQDRFPQARCRLDLYHGDEHLWTVANELYGERPVPY